MIGDGCKVDRAIDLGRYGLLPIGIGECDDVTLGVFIGAIGIVFLIRKKGIEGVSGVNMEIAKERKLGVG